MKTTSHHETITPHDIRFRHFLRTVGPIYVGVSLWFSSLAMLGGWDEGIAAVLGGFLAVLAVVSTIVLFYMGVQACCGLLYWRWKAPRKMFVQDGDLVIEYRRKQPRIALADCTWCFGATMADPLCMFVRCRKAILIHSRIGCVACGLRPSLLQGWQEILMSEGVPYHSPGRVVAILSVSLCSVPIVGFPMGLLAGMTVGHVTGDQSWNHALMWPCIAASAVVAAFYVSRNRMKFEPPSEPRLTSFGSSCRRS